MIIRKSTHDILRDSLLSKAGIKVSQLDQLREDNWSKRFELLMRNRLIVGSFRYGPFNKQNRSTKKVVGAIIKRATEYLKTGNDELLVDIANLSMKEFEVGKHPKKHFKSIDNGKHI